MTRRRKSSTSKARPETPQGVTFRVAEGVLSVSFSDKVYPVEDGRVVLPADEQWYFDLIGTTIFPIEED